MALRREQVMNIQELRLPAANVKVIGRPMWQVSLRASLQRGRKRLKAMLCAAALNESFVMVFCPEIVVPDGSASPRRKTPYHRDDSLPMR
jgi:hypothetical protein